MPDRFCNNECTARGLRGILPDGTNIREGWPCEGKCKGKEAKGMTYYEYVGPVKIVIVDPPPNVYIRTVIVSVLITSVYILMGAIVVVGLYTSLDFKQHWATNVHIWLSTFAFQLSLPSALLMENSLNIPSIPLTPKERLRELIVLKIMSFLCTTVSIVILCLWKIEWKFASITMHSISGALASLFLILDVFSQICNYKSNAKGPKFLGLTAFVISSICYWTGIIKPIVLETFKTKANSLGIFMGINVGYFTIVVVLVTLLDWFYVPKKKEGVTDASVGSSSQGSQIDDRR